MYTHNIPTYKHTYMFNYKDEHVEIYLYTHCDGNGTNFYLIISYLKSQSNII